MKTLQKYRGQYYTENGEGGWRLATSDELKSANISLPEPMAQVVADTFANERSPDVSMGQRFVMKNFSKDLDSAKKYLSALGLEVRQVKDPSFTEPMPLWVRKGVGDPWRPVDPSSGNPREWVEDILDLTSDAVSGVLTTAAAAGGMSAGGPLGGAAAGGTVAGLAEYAREVMGQQLGIPQEPSKLNALIGGAIAAPLSAIPIPKTGLPLPSGGFVPSLAPSIGEKIASQASRGMLQMASKISGISPELLSARAKMPGFGAMDSMKDSLNKIRDFIDFTRSKQGLSPARQEADAIVAEADKRGVTVNMEPFFDRLAQFTNADESIPGSGIKTYETARSVRRDASIPNMAQGTYLRFKNSLDVAQPPAKINAVPARLAEEIRRDAQELAMGKKAYQNVDHSNASRETASSWADTARAAVEQALDATDIVGPSTGKPYSLVMDDVEATMKGLSKLRKGFYRGKDEIDQIKAAEATMKTLYGDIAGQKYVAALEDIDKRYGVVKSFQDAYPEGLAAPLKRTSFGLRFGTEENPSAFGAMGKPNIAPRLTAAGRFLGTNLPLPGPGLVAGGAGFAAGGIPGAIGGVMFASPTTQLALVKAAQGVAAGAPAARQAAGNAIGGPVSRATLQAIMSELQKQSQEPLKPGQTADLSQ